MIVVEFKKIPVPEKFQEQMKVKSVYIIKYLIDLYGKPFKHGQVLKDKSEVMKFCESNNITMDELRSVWNNGKNNGAT